MENYKEIAMHYGVRLFVHKDSNFDLMDFCVESMEELIHESIQNFNNLVTDIYIFNNILFFYSARKNNFIIEYDDFYEYEDYNFNSINEVEKFILTYK